MRLASRIRPGFFFRTILGFLVWQFGAARERGPRVEVRRPFAPVPVKLVEEQALLYELPVTNFDSVPLTLQHLEVFADAEKTQPLVAISGDGLPNAHNWSGCECRRRRRSHKGCRRNT
jgi:hypothetical protein